MGTIVNAVSILLTCAEVKFPRRRNGDQPAVGSGAPFLRGRPRRRGGCAGIGELMTALERTCSGIRSACWRSR